MDIIATANVSIDKKEDSFIIRIPENSKEEVNINLEKKNSLKIFIGKNSEVKIVEVSGDFSEHYAEIFVGENSKVFYMSLQNFNRRKESSSRRKAFVSENGYIEWINCYFGDKEVKSLIQTILDGEESRCSLLNVVFGRGQAIFGVDAEVFHNGARSKSNIVNKIVMDDKSKIVNRGDIKIKNKVIGCDGYQKSDIILLGGDASAEVIPSLRIENDEVRCSHGTTISQIDEDKLFYMMSRGLDEKTAKKLIIKGFFNPVMDKLENETLKKELILSVSKALGDVA